MFFGGLYLTLLAHGVVGKKPGTDEKMDAWRLKWGRHAKWLGPAMMAFSIILPLLNTR
jgi:hypothetical protein